MKHTTATLWITSIALLALAPAGARAMPGEAAKFTAPFGAESSWFGRDVAYDGQTVLISGTEYDEVGTRFGVVATYERTAAGWEQGAVIRPTRARDWFGTSISLDDDLLAIGAVGDCAKTGDYESTPGTVHLYERSEAGWTEQAVLEGPACASFGTSVDLAGDVLVVGSLDAYEGQPIGVFIYERQGGEWIRTTRVVPPEGSERSSFGEEVATDGRYVVVGSVGNAYPGVAGQVYVYEKQAGTWTSVVTLRSSASDYDGFGMAVDIADGAVLVGAPAAPPEGEDGVGAVYEYRAASGWTLHQRIAPSEATPGARFGSSLALRGDVLAIGAPWETAAGNGSAGAVRLFVRDAGTWLESARFEASDGRGWDGLGGAVALGDDAVLASAPGHDTVCGDGAGAAYLFDPDAAGGSQHIQGTCGPARHGPSATVTSTLAVSLPGYSIPVSGDATGIDAPVEKVEVTFERGVIRTVWADVACEGLQCTWSVEVPRPPLNPWYATIFYNVTAQGTDTHGNVGWPSAPTQVKVIALPS